MIIFFSMSKINNNYSFKRYLKIGSKIPKINATKTVDGKLNPKK